MDVKTPAPAALFHLFCFVLFFSRSRKVVDILEYVTLGDITTSTQIYYDPDPRSTVVEDDVELLEGHFDIQEEEEDDKDTDRYGAVWYFACASHSPCVQMR